MTQVWTWLGIVGLGLGLGLGLVWFFLVRTRHGAIPTGKTARLYRMSAVWAQLSASVFGAKLRSLFASAESKQRIDAAARKKSAELVAATMGQMKGALMKLGQMISFVTDDVPDEFKHALATLQASAPPMAFSLIRDVAERELGRPLERAFAHFDEQPLAAASIGQVHRARLPSGEEVVVKIQYPGVAEAIASDLANVSFFYNMVPLLFPGVEPGPVVEEMRARLTEELDYRHEAQNQAAFFDLYDGHPFMRVPRVFPSHSTERVLTSEYIAGTRFEQIVGAPAEQRNRWGEILFRFVIGNILRLGVFNGDPHPGNYLFTDDGKIAFLDFGCVKYFPETMLGNWKQLVRAHLAGDRDRFLHQLKQLDFLKSDSPMDADTMYEYFLYFYESFHEDRVYTFTREYNAKSLKQVFRPEGKFAPVSKMVNMPRDFVFVNRIQWGVVSLLAKIDATQNWHRIETEYLLDRDTATELGALDCEHFAKWRARHGLGSDGEVRLTRDGPRRATPAR